MKIKATVRPESREGQLLELAALGFSGLLDRELDALTQELKASAADPSDYRLGLRALVLLLRRYGFDPEVVRDLCIQVPDEINFAEEEDVQAVDAALAEFGTT